MPETQTQTPLENEPICEFCLAPCESGGNSFEPIETFGWKENRCCDDCNLNIVIPTRLEIRKKEHKFCHRCSGYIRHWNPVLCNYCNTIHSFCDECLNKCDAYTGKFSKIDDDDESACGEPQDEFCEDEESSDDE